MILTQLTDQARVTIHRFLQSNTGTGFAPIRLAKEFLQTANDLTGRPFCTQAELDDRRGDLSAERKTSTLDAKEAAPVRVYFDGKDHRTLAKVEELLKSRTIAYQVLDVTDDEATRSWAATAAKLNDFPLVFVAGEAIGGIHELTQASVNGELAKKVSG